MTVENEIFMSDLSHCYILGQRVDATHYEDATNRILFWASGKESRYVCASPVHMIMEGVEDPSFQQIVNNADLVTPDGMPLVWGLKIQGFKEATRVYGPTLMLSVLQAAEKKNICVGFYGGTETILETLQKKLLQQFPKLNITYAFAPPFRPLTRVEDQDVVSTIQKSGTQILFVGIGCPKQEKWMAEHKKQLSTVMLGVGAAFDFLAGNKKQAPSWMQNNGLEWFFRMLSEPKRLGPRYIKTIPKFSYLFLKQIIRQKWEQK